MSNFQTSKRIKLKKASGQFPNYTKDSSFNETYSNTLENVFESLSMDSPDQLKDYYMMSAYSTIYGRASTKLKETVKVIDSIRYFYLVEVLLNQITEDALAPRVGDDEIVKYSCKNVKIQQELNDLKKRISLDQIIENIAPEILAYGEYTLATKISTGKNTSREILNGSPTEIDTDTKVDGLIEIKDIVDQGTVISLSQDGKIRGYIVYDQVSGRVEIREKSDYVKFQMGGTRVKVETEDMLPIAYIKNPQVRAMAESLPRFIRLGKSVLYAMIPKLKELELLEKLVPASKINQLSQGNLIGMNLPDNYNLKDAMKAVRSIESAVNKKISVDPVTNEITVESILSTAGKTKVIPLFGEKGKLEQLDFRDPEAGDLLQSTKEIRELILDSIGIPSELVFKSDGESKSDILKRYAKYLRKLKKFQKTIAEGCKQIAYIHLSNKGYKFKEEDIDVVFNNTLVEIDSLDKLEHADVTVSLLDNLKNFFNDLSEEDSPYRDAINLDKVAEFMDENLKAAGLNDAILTKKEGGPSLNKRALDKDGVDSKGNPTTDGSTIAGDIAAKQADKDML